MRGEDATWSYVTSRLIEVSKYHTGFSTKSARAEGQDGFIGSMKKHKDITYFKCGKKGHFSRDCRSKSSFQREFPVDRENIQQNLIIHGFRNRIATLYSKGDAQKGHRITINSGTTEHATNNLEILQDIESIPEFKVEVADG